MSEKTGASAVEAGFHYQDVAALYLFLNNIKDLDSFEIEGKEDIDLIWNDGNKSFIQAKETTHPYQTFDSQKVTKALSVLSNDLAEYEKNKIQSLIFLTNSHFPFGVRAGREFDNSDYIFYTYKDLPPKMKKKILSLMKSSKNCKIDTNLLNVIKIEYFGSDDRTKLRLLQKSIEEFMELAHISPFKYRSLLHNWSFMVMRSSEYLRKKINKNEFAGYTSLIYLDDTSRIESFFEEFDISHTDEEYIKNQYSEYLNSLTLDMNVINKINTLAIEYNEHNHESRHRREYELDFVNKNCQKLASVLGIKSTEEKDLAIAKFIMWLIIVNKVNFDSIKEALF